MTGKRPDQLDADEDDKRYHRSLFLWAALGVFSMFTLFWAFAMPRFDVSDGVPSAAMQCAGLRGDAFGLLNTLFSGLAFAGVLVALELQRRDVLEQRKENVAARDEAEKHTKATDRMRIANLLGVVAQINTTLGRANEYGHEQIAELRKVLQRAKEELDWAPASEEEVVAELRSRGSVR